MTAIDAFDNDYPIHGACKDVIAQTAYFNRDIIEGTGWHCVESALMVPVLPYGLRGAMLSGGINAAALSQSLNALGLKTRAVDVKVGVASAIKMCRRVVIEGLEALIARWQPAVTGPSTPYWSRLLKPSPAWAGRTRCRII